MPTNKPISVVFKKSTRDGKKRMAIFTRSSGRTKTIHFGADGMSDYTKHKDPERKKRYIARHKKNENWNNPMTAGALSRWILWNKTSMRESINDFKKKFKLI
jgi:2,3-bisphosphoglycerate-independent phosphoglycerate mutase